MDMQQQVLYLPLLFISHTATMPTSRSKGLFAFQQTLLARPGKVRKILA